MLGERSDQRGLWEADRLYLDHVGRDTFYGMLASLRGRLFRDAEFAEFYCPDNGRDSVPPSLLATALLLQSHDKVSDAEAKARADFDIRWKVALGIEAEDRPFAKSTLQVFRAQLILHDKVREVFEGSLRLARESGYLQKRGMKVALDTTSILGRGAVKDTCNLLADGIVKLLRALAQLKGINVGQWAKSQGYHRYLGSSVKGEAAIDWADRQARAGLLAGIVGDADRLLELSRQAQGELPEDSAERQRIVDAAELLGRLLLQDVERTDDGVSLKDGVSRDRMMSVHDPEMRHGHKSSSRRFDGHKAAIVVDTDSQLITAVEVLPGNAPDNLGALELVEASEANTGVTVEEAMGDAAYGDGDTRQTFADAGRTLIARVPGRPNRSHFPKEDFRIDLESGSCTCPAGQVTRTIVPAGRRTDQTGRTYRLEAFRFDAAVCGECPLRSQCLAAKPGTGRTVRLHPQEALLQQARALQHSEAFAEYRQRRVVVEHRLVKCLVNRLALGNLVEDGLDGGVPDKGLGVSIGCGEVLLDGSNQLGHALEAPAPDPLLRQLPEPPLNQVQPRGAGRRKVQREPWVLLQPRPHLGLLVGRIVVQDQVQRSLLGKLPVQPPQKTQELLVPVLGPALSDHPPIQDVEGGKEGGGPMALVVMSHGPAAPFLHGQAGLGALESLDLALLIHAQDHGFVGRIEVQPHHVGEFLGEPPVLRELESLRPVRL